MSDPPEVTGPFRTVRGPHLLIAIPPPVISALLIDDLIRVESHKPPPNFWWRFWYWVLLGWRWERLP